jgi:hypothetical protein
MDGDLAVSDGSDIEVENGEEDDILDENEAVLGGNDLGNVRNDDEQWIRNYFEDSDTDSTKCTEMVYRL